MKYVIFLFVLLISLPAVAVFDHENVPLDFEIEDKLIGTMTCDGGKSTFAHYFVRDEITALSINVNEERVWYIFVDEAVLYEPKIYYYRSAEDGVGDEAQKSDFEEYMREHAPNMHSLFTANDSDCGFVHKDIVEEIFP